MNESILNWTVELATRSATWERNNDPEYQTIDDCEISAHSLDAAKNQADWYAQDHSILKSDLLWHTGWINTPEKCFRVYVRIDTDGHDWYRVYLIPHGFRITQVMPYHDRIGLLY